MFWYFLKIENTKNLKRTLLWVELGLIALAVLLLNLGFYFVTRTSGQAGVQQQLAAFLSWPGALLNALSMLGGNALGGLMAVILVGSMTAQEYSWRTLHLWLSRGVPRPAFLAAKFLALVPLLVLMVLVALLSAGAITALLSLGAATGLLASGVNFWQLFLSLLRTAYSLLPYAALAFFLAVTSRSTIVAIGGGLAYTFLIESLLSQVLLLAGGGLSRLGAYLPSGLANELLQLNAAVAAGGTGPNGQGTALPLLGPLPAAVGIALWTLALVGLAIWIFRRQDLTE